MTREPLTKSTPGSALTFVDTARQLPWDVKIYLGKKCNTHVADIQNTAYLLTQNFQTCAITENSGFRFHVRKTTDVISAAKVYSNQRLGPAMNKVQVPSKTAFQAFLCVPYEQLILLAAKSAQNVVLRPSTVHMYCERRSSRRVASSVSSGFHVIDARSFF